MFAYIKGILVFSSSGSVVVEACGIGYKIFIPNNALVNLPQIGHSIILHLAFVVREQAQTLYGFPAMDERDFFETLLGVTGIGPKLALALIGHLSLEELHQAILQEDKETICRVPGIGKKGAERLIIELRDKISAPSVSNYILAPTSNPRNQIIGDALNALINLGYTHMAAQKAIKKSLKDTEEMDLPALIASALKHV